MVRAKIHKLVCGEIFWIETCQNMDQSVIFMVKSDLKWSVIQFCGPPELIMAFMVPQPEKVWETLI